MKRLLILFSVLLPLITYAHDGHGIFDASNILHYIATPEHALPLSIGIVLTGLLLKNRRKKVA